MISFCAYYGYKDTSGNFALLVRSFVQRFSRSKITIRREGRGLESRPGKIRARPGVRFLRPWQSSKLHASCYPEKLLIYSLRRVSPKYGVNALGGMRYVVYKCRSADSIHKSRGTRDGGEKMRRKRWRRR